jgi:hypothetical protein
VTASTTTTIRGVSIFTRQRKRKADVFDIALSPEGIAIRRPGRSEQHMTWERIAQWELQERPGCIVLTLRGGGSVTPLVVKGWSLEDLETVMRDATAATTGPDDRSDPLAGSADPLLPLEVSEATEPQPEPLLQTEPAQEQAPALQHEPALEHGPALQTGTKQVGEPVQPRAARRQAARRPQRSFGKALATVVLLGVLAAAVVIVLLQSAGVINWSFLGPVA